MAMRSTTLAIAALLAVSCVTEIDLSNLQFATRQHEDLGRQEQEVEVEDWTIVCSEYYHCIFEENEGDMEFLACRDNVETAGQEEVQVMEQCRLQWCSAYDEMVPGSPSFDGDSLLDCMLTKCRGQVVACTAGLGGSSCLDFADYWNEWDQGAECEYSDRYLCLLDELSGCDAEAADGIVAFLDCLPLIPRSISTFENCRAYCEL